MEKLYEVEVLCTVTDFRTVKAKNKLEAGKKVMNGEYISAGGDHYEGINSVESIKEISEKVN